MSTVRLDVRPFHERGEEPFAAIMNAVESLKSDQALLLVNSFEPVPLYRVLEKRGFSHQTSEISPGEWHVVFRRTS
jgi:uncharacterized protein (DUF2249 family)